MKTSLDIIAEWKKSCSCATKPEDCKVCTVGMIEALQARIVNELEVSQQLLSIAKLVACTCQRTYQYHGAGVNMCRRCQVLVLHEMLTEGKSETQRRFEAKIL